MHNKIFFFGEWQIEPASNSIRQGDTVQTLEPKAMDVLRALCQHPNEVLSAEDLLNQCWPGADIGDNPVHKVMAQLRKALGDEASNPRYIETIRKRGYRAIAPVVFPAGDADAVSEGEWQNASPFPGLRPFTVDEAGVFFGRGDAVTQLLRSMVAQHRAGHALNLVLGPSGSGKTSLVNAGIIPNLLSEHGFDGVRVLSVAMLDMADVTPERVFLDLASALLDWEISDAPVFAGISADSLARELQHQPEKLMALFANTMAEAAAKQQLQLLLIDRLEVLLSANHISDEARATFLHALDALARSGATLVIATCRNDFYPLIAQHRALMHGKASGAHFDVQPPTRAEMLQMIRLPAKAAGLQWQSDQIDSLDHMLCDDAAGNPDALPMLQYTLHELYQQHGDDKLLKIADYHALGGIEGAIGKRAEALFSEQSDAVKAALPTVLAKLVSLSSDEKSITSRAALWSQLANDDERQLVQALIDHRLLVSHLVGNEPGFSLAHEALLRRWPRVVEWIAQHRYNLKIKSRLQLAAERWLSEGQAKEFLIADGKPLLEAKEIEQNALFQLTSAEQQYIQQSSRRSQFRKLVKRATVASLALLTLLSVAMTIRSVESEKRAEMRRAQADDLLGFMVGEFADKVRPLGRLDLLGGVSEKALEYLSTSSSLSAGSKLKHAKALQVFAEVSLTKGDKQRAEHAFQYAKSILLDISLSRSAVDYGNSVSPLHFKGQVKKELGVSSYWLGTIEFNAGNYASAMEHYKEYLRFTEEFNEIQPNDAAGLMEQSYAHTNLGSVALFLRKYDEAEDHFFLSLHFSEKATGMMPGNRVWRADRIDTQSWLASTREAKGDLKGALTERDREHTQIVDLVASAPSEKKWLWSLASCLKRRAHLLWKMGETKSAITDISAALDVYSDLASYDERNIEYKEQLILAKLVKAQWISLLEEKASSSIETIESEVVELQELVGKRINLEKILLKIRSAQVYANITNSNMNVAQRDLDHYFRYLEGVKKGSEPDASRLIFDIYGLAHLAELSKRSGEHEKSLDACFRMLRLLSEQEKIDLDAEIQSYLVRANTCVGNHLEAKKKLNWLNEIGYREITFTKAITSINLQGD